MSNVALPLNVRTSLMAIKGIEKQQNIYQTQLATGLKVNDPVHKPKSYFTASRLNGRSESLGELLDSMKQGVNVIKTASQAMDAIKKLIYVAKSKVSEALEIADDPVGATETPNADKRASFGVEFDKILDEITKVGTDAHYNGINLLKGDDLTLVFNEKTGNDKNVLTVQGVDYTDISDAVEGLGLQNSTDLANWSTKADIEASADQVIAALEKLETDAGSFGMSLAITTARMEFTENLISTLEGGADDLIQADMTEVAVSNQALNVRAQIAMSSTASASGQAQNLMRFF